MGSERKLFVDLMDVYCEAVGKMSRVSSALSRTLMESISDENEHLKKVLMSCLNSITYEQGEVEPLWLTG